MAEQEQKTVTRTDARGNEVEVPVGADGENPVSPNNPPLKATGFMSEDAYLSTLGDSVVAENVRDEKEPVGDEPTTIGNTGDGEPETVSDEDTDSEEESEAPGGNASKAEWVEYAVSRGADREEAESKTRDELRDKYSK